jgi:hypothetical protein
MSDENQVGPIEPKDDRLREPPPGSAPPLLRPLWPDAGRALPPAVYEDGLLRGPEAVDVRKPSPPQISIYGLVVAGFVLWLVFLAVSIVIELVRSVR